MRKTVLSLILCVLTLAACNLGGPNEANIETSDAPTAFATNTPARLTRGTATSTVEGTEEAPGQPTVIRLPTRPASGGTTGGSTAPTTEELSAQNADFAEPVLNALGGNDHGYVVTMDSGIVGEGVSLFPNWPIPFFSQNPVNTNRYVLIDPSLLYVTDAGGGNAFRLEGKPYTTFQPGDRASNNAAATVAYWSPDGQYVAFIVAGRLNANDGVWYFQPNGFEGVQQIVDCPPIPSFPGCDIVRPAEGFARWESREVAWSPNSQSLIVTVHLPDNGRNGIVWFDVTRDERFRDARPRIYPYDYGNWTNDGRILASGRNETGALGVWILNRDGSVAETITSGSSLWLGWANQSDAGDYYALGTTNANGQGALSIYDMDGNALTGAIGDGFPQRVEWSPDGTAVLVVVNGRSYVASIDGTITDLTSTLGGRAAAWGH
jgi:hypothetical protein